MPVGLTAGAPEVTEHWGSWRIPLQVPRSLFPEKACVSWVEAAHLVDGKANGEEVGPQLPVLPSVLLHQGHQKAADHLGVVGVVVLLQQLQAVLGVGPESVCATQK